MKVYEMAPEQKIEMKQKVLDYCDHEFSYEKMISNWDQTLCRVIAEFNRLLKFTQPSTPAEQREKMTASPDEQ